jgi:hypothetical protein
MFPGVRDRFLRSAKWHKERYGIVPLFGLYWNLCINGIFPGTKRIHCAPHADSKNGISVCVLMIYVRRPSKLRDPSSGRQLSHEADTFDHTRRSWLVIWELGVVVQLPPWVLAIYPSSLLYHFNIDIHGAYLLLSFETGPHAK